MAGPKNFSRTQREGKERNTIWKEEGNSLLAVLIASVNKLYQPGRGQSPPFSLPLVNKNARPVGGSWKNDVEPPPDAHGLRARGGSSRGMKRVSSLREKAWAQPFPIRKFDGPTGVSGLLIMRAPIRAVYSLKMRTGSGRVHDSLWNCLQGWAYLKQKENSLLVKQHNY